MIVTIFQGIIYSGGKKSLLFIIMHKYYYYEMIMFNSIHVQTKTEIVMSNYFPPGKLRLFGW
jgi:hypothetical protein